VVNDPVHVRNAPEKLFVTHFEDVMPPTLITNDRQQIMEFRAEHQDIIVKPLFGNGGDAFAECDDIARPQPLCIADEGLPAAQVDPLVQSRADPRFPAPPFELGGNDLGVVEHQHVAGAQHVGQVARAAILESPLAPHHQHARGIARPRGAQSYPLRRKVEIEQINTHGVWTDYPELVEGHAWRAR